MTPAETTQFEQLLVGKIPADGAPISNAKLMAALGWEEAQYWEIRNGLVDRGLIELGRGRGGTVRRLVASPPPPPVVPVPIVPTPGTAGPARMREDELYTPIAAVIEEHWIRDRRFESSIVQVTAQQGRRLTGGKWSRPDIAVATLSTYP